MLIDILKESGEKNSDMDEVSEERRHPPYKTETGKKQGGRRNIGANANFVEDFVRLRVPNMSLGMELKDEEDAGYIHTVVNSFADNVWSVTCRYILC